MEAGAARRPRLPARPYRQRRVTPHGMCLEKHIPIDLLEDASGSRPLQPGYRSIYLLK